MNKKIIIFFLSTVILQLTIEKNINALMVETHSAINDAIATKKFNGFSLNEYLKNNLNIVEGFQKLYEGYAGLFDSLKMNKTVEEWIEYGGTSEDLNPVPELYERSFMHFHDPLEPLGSAGFNSLLTGQRDSSIIWALSTTAQNGLNLGDYSWPAARNYFYNALVATDKDTKDHNFAKCFRSVGQLMHLVEDASVPEHTRNEEHAFGYHYEIYVNKNLNGPLFNNIIPIIPYSPVLSSTGYSNNNLGLTGLPTSRLFDTDNYNGTNPEITTGSDIGLAEYTNANFFGRRTAMSYDYPRRAVLEQYSGLNPAGTKRRVYYRKTGDGVQVEHLAAKAYLGYSFDEHHIQPFYDGFITLDENCYKDYASILLPRAEGYAFSLMQYFFRGDIDAVDAKEVTTTDANGNVVISGVAMKVKNNMADEDIGGGELSVSCRYKKKDDTAYSYTNSLDTQGNGTPVAFLGHGQTTDSAMTINFTAASIPPDATDRQYMLVYRGMLGQEEGAVAGKSFKAASVIDDFEREQVGWTAEDSRATPSISSETYKVGQKAMRIDITNEFQEEIIYDVFPYYGGWPWQYNWGCPIVDKIGQKQFTKGDILLTGIEIWMNSSSGNFTMDFTVKIYQNTGIPGSLYYTGDTRTINSWELPLSNGGWKAERFDLRPVYLDESEGGYNIFAETTNVSNDYIYGINASVNNSVFDGQSYRNYYDNCTAEAWSWTTLDWAARIYAIGTKKIAEANIAADCSNKNILTFFVKSNICGSNILQFIYGNEMNVVKTPVSISTTDWQKIEINISDAVDKSQLNYFAFKLGKDSFDDTGRPKANTVYIDQIAAE